MVRELRNALYGFQRDFGGEVTEFIYRLDGFGIRIENIGGATMKDMKRSILGSIVLQVKGYDEYQRYNTEIHVNGDWAYDIYYNEIKNYFMDRGVKSLIDEQIEEYF